MKENAVHQIHFLCVFEEFFRVSSHKHKCGSQNIKNYTTVFLLGRTRKKLLFESEICITLLSHRKITSYILCDF